MKVPRECSHGQPNRGGILLVYQCTRPSWLSRRSLGVMSRHGHNVSSSCGTGLMSLLLLWHVSQPLDASCHVMRVPRVRFRLGVQLSQSFLNADLTHTYCIVLISQHFQQISGFKIHLGFATQTYWMKNCIQSIHNPHHSKIKLRKTLTYSWMFFSPIYYICCRPQLNS